MTTKITNIIDYNIELVRNKNIECRKETRLNCTKGFMHRYVSSEFRNVCTIITVLVIAILSKYYYLDEYKLSNKLR
jgi:hypothetical protein